MALIENTRRVAEIDMDRFDAIWVAAGQAPMFSFDKAADLHQTIVEFYEAGKVAAGKETNALAH
jgi:putative intracellular protease/amidase